jgi:hypothetical protein
LGLVWALVARLAEDLPSRMGAGVLRSYLEPAYRRQSIVLSGVPLHMSTYHQEHAAVGTDPGACTGPGGTLSPSESPSSPSVSMSCRSRRRSGKPSSAIHSMSLVPSPPCSSRKVVGDTSPGLSRRSVEPPSPARASRTVGTRSCARKRCQRSGRRRRAIGILTTPPACATWRCS